MSETRKNFNVWLTAGFIAAPLYISITALLGFLEEDYSHLTTTMSVLGGVDGFRGLLFNFCVFFTGILVISFGTGLFRQNSGNKMYKFSLGLLWSGGLGLAGAGLFPCSAACRNIFIEPDFTGRLHMISSLLAGMGTGLAPLFIWIAIRREELWQNLKNMTFIFAILSNLPGIIFWITILSDNRLPAIEGLIQRLGFIFVLLWMLYVSLIFFRNDKDKSIV
ncbi:MAG: DUF998 domain-containing protein [Spirochaetia bacterium]|nr:DUF998 domain-containing protein [Spirochaetia bacterium]